MQHWNFNSRSTFRLYLYIRETHLKAPIKFDFAWREFKGWRCRQSHIWSLSDALLWHHHKSKDGELVGIAQRKMIWLWLIMVHWIRYRIDHDKNYLTKNQFKMAKRCHIWIFENIVFGNSSV